jgi:alkylation response protein AidB-like acyl-CoA dehydrogenase
MDFTYSDRFEEFRARLSRFMDENVVPRIADFERKTRAGTYPPTFIE